MAVTLEQTVVTAEQTYTSSGVALDTMFGVTAGSTIVVCVMKHASGTRTWTIADDVNSGDYDERANEVDGNGSGKKITIHTKYNVAAGDTIVTLTSNADIGLPIAMYEVSGVGATPTLVVSTLAATSSDVDATFGYPCSADGTVIDTTTAAFICSCMALHANPGSVVAGSGFTLDSGGGSNRWASQSGIFSSAEADNRGFFGEGGVNRHWAGGVLALEEEAAGGSVGSVLSSPVQRNHHLLRR